jgi:aminoglycoside phosphotransferase
MTAGGEPGDEVEAQRAACDALALSAPDLLRDLPGRRRVLRAGDVVLKAFATAELYAWLRERAGLRALQGTGLAPDLLSEGERWVAVSWIESEPPEDNEQMVHEALGRWLRRLHDVSPDGLVPWPLADRLRHHLQSPPPGCSQDLAADVAAAAQGWLPHLREETFVHGDWGDSNVLSAVDEPARILCIIDFEDVRVGDAAEDFKWQAMTGPTSTMLPPMLDSYGDLGPRAGERLAAATAEHCLEVLGWGGSGSGRARTESVCLPTLRALADGWLPGV